MSESTLLRLAMPALTILFAALGAAAWLVPTPLLTPRSVVGVDSGAPPFQFAEKKPVDWSSQVPKPQPKDWGALVAQIDELWDKPAAVADNGSDEGQKEEEIVKIEPLAWTYTAYAGTSKFPAAFVNLASTGVRVLYVNDTVQDEYDPHGGRILVLKITPEEIVVSRMGQEQSIKLAVRDLRNNSLEQPSSRSRGTNNPAFNPMNQMVAPPGSMIEATPAGVRAR